MSPPSVQARIDLVAIEGGVARFGTHKSSHAVAVLDLFADENSLANADEATQEEVLAGRAQFLNAQTSPVQILVRAEPVDLDGHLRRVQARASLLPEALAEVARDYVGFVAELAHQRTLLERHCYVVLPDNAGPPAVSVGRHVRNLLSSVRLAGRKAGKTEDATVISAELARRLAARCDLVSRQLGRSGLRTQRLDSHSLAELFHRCWSPELARVQRLRDELGAYTGLAVGSNRVASPRPALRADDESDEPEEGHGSDEPVANGLSDDERLLTLGTRRLADLVAPSSYEIRTDHLRLDSQYVRALAVTAYPRLVTPGWLSILAESDLPIELSVHVRPLASADMVRALSLQVARLQSSRLAQLRGERIADPEREIALQDAERLRERLQRGEERLL